MQSADASAARADGPAPGERLAAEERRLRLLCAHLAGRAVRARVELDDLVQEIFLRVLAGAHGLPPSEPGEGALWRILAQHARHVVIDVARALRTQKRAGVEQPLARSDWTRVPPARGPGPHTVAVGGETSRVLARAFLALSPEHRRVLGLRQFEGLSAADTARRMGRSESAIHSLYRRALAAWQEELERKPTARDDSPVAPRPDAP